jgi:hypothetical protein
VLLAVANIFYGLINVLDVSAGAWGAYTAVFSVIVAAGIAKDRCGGGGQAGWSGGRLAGSYIASKGDMPALLLACTDRFWCSFNYLHLPPPGAKTMNGTDSSGAPTTASTVATGQEVGLVEL